MFASVYASFVTNDKRYDLNAAPKKGASVASCSLGEQDSKTAQLRDALLCTEGRAAAEALVQGGEISSTDEFYGDAFLRRWLSARRWDVGAAAGSIKSHASWRAALVPHGCIQTSDIPNELSCGKAFLLGCDRLGRATILFQARKHMAWARKLDELQRYYCYLLDLAVSSCDCTMNPQGQVCVILDLTGLGPLNMDVQAVKELFDLLGKHYVGRLGQLVMYNPPLIFWGAWNALSPLLPPATLRKVLVVSPKEQRTLIEAVGPQVLPAELGGSLADAPPLSDCYCEV